MSRWSIPTCIVVLASAFAASAGGCSHLNARRVQTPPPTAGVEKAAGITYYLSRPQFRVEMLGTAGGKKAAPEYRVLVDYVADHSQRYEIGLDSGLLTSDIFEVNLTDDGRLTGINTDITDRTPEYIKALGEAALAVLDVAALSTSKPYEQAIDYGREKPVKYTPLGQTQEVPIDEAMADELKILEKGIKDAKPPLDAATVAQFEKLQPPLKAIRISLEGDLKSQFEDHSGLITTRPKPDVPLPSDQLSRAKQWKAVVAMEAAIESKLDPSPKAAQQNLAKYFNNLQNEAQLQLAQFITSGGTQGDPAGGKIKEYREAVGLLLQAHESLYGKNLSDRRKVLAEFLAKPINAPADPSVLATWYSDFRAELDHVNSEIDKLIPDSPASPTVITATEVTRIYDSMKAIHLPRLHGFSIDDLAVLGEVYWRFGVSKESKSAGLDGIIFFYQEVNQ